MLAIERAVHSPFVGEAAMQSTCDVRELLTAPETEHAPALEVYEVTRAFQVPAAVVACAVPDAVVGHAVALDVDAAVYSSTT